MTNADQAKAEALTISVHSRAATDTEILTTEFIACYLTADMAWQYDSDHQELKKASTGTRRSLRPQLTEDNDLGFRSPMRGLPVSSTNAPSAILYLLLLIQIRLVSIHGQDIKILTTYFTEEYYQSFRKADQTFKIADQSFKNADQSFKNVRQSFKSIGQSVKKASQFFRKTDQSFKKVDQSFNKADQSTSGNLHVRIESFRLPDDWDPQINHMVQKLTEPSTWLQKLTNTSNERCDDR